MSTLWATQSLQPDRLFRLDAISDPTETHFINHFFIGTNGRKEEGFTEQASVIQH